VRRGKDNWYLIKRTLGSKTGKKKIVFYVHLALWDSADVRKKVSTGKSTKWEAEEKAEEIFQEEFAKINPGAAKSAPERNSARTLREYLDEKRFFKWGECQYIATRLSEGKPISERYAKIRRYIIDKYLYTAPFIDMPIEDIRKPDIETWKGQIVEKSRSSASKALQVLKLAFRQAIDEEVITTNPADRVGSISEVTAYEREDEKVGIFTELEMRRLFFRSWDLAVEIENRANEVEVSGIISDQFFQYSPWRNEVEKTMFLLAATTGMRRGEILALHWENVNFSENTIDVVRAFKDGLAKQEGLPKWERRRIAVPVPKITMIWLAKLYLDNKPNGTDYVFVLRGQTNRISFSTWERAFNRVLDRIGISEKKKSDRKLRPHSFRHTLNTYLLSKGYSEMFIQRTFGWSQRRTQIRYSNPLLEQTQKQAEIVDGHYDTDEVMKSKDIRALLLEAMIEHDKPESIKHAAKLPTKKLSL
jgi:integrase